MRAEIEFDLQSRVETWHAQLKADLPITAADSEELKNHLLDMMDELKASGLDEEEAFLIASKRMGNSVEWEADYSEVNKPVIQMRRSLVILAGVLAYFLLYYFINCSSKLLYITLLYFKINGYVAISWISKYLIAIHLMVMVFVASIYFFEQKTISFIENIKLKPKHTLYLLLTAIGLSISNTCLNPILKVLMKYDRPLISHFYDVYLYLDYSFPLIICTSFTILYAKYYKKAKI